MATESARNIKPRLCLGVRKDYVFANVGRASFLLHMNHVSDSPTDGNGPTQGRRKTLTMVGIEPMTFWLDHRCATD